MVRSASLAAAAEAGDPPPAPHDWGVPLAGKLHPPAPRRVWVPRQRLVERLAAGDAKLVLVSAPAGFGKTIAVTQWRAAERAGRAFAWVSLDPGDDDPVRLWSHIVSALQRALPALAAEDLLACLRAPAPDIAGTLLPGLVNALACLPERVVLVLDDLHLVTRRRCHKQLESLLASLLPPAKVVIISRTVPPLQVARLRAAGDLTEIGMSELRFTREEAAGLIGAVAASPLGQRDLTDLVDRTEGWPAALFLAALSFRDQPDSAAFVAGFTGGNRYVAGYLLEEVIDCQPAHIARFLTRTAILDRFTAELCDAVTGTTDAAEIIELLERENLFLVPLDESRRWFRYHHLFAQALRARLSAREPALLPQLHRRASGWFRAHSLPEEAIGHALAAGDTGAAIEVMAAHWYEYVNAGRLDTVRGWLAALDDRLVAAHPLAAHTAAWVAAMSGEPGTVRRLLPVVESGSAESGSAESGDRGEPLPDGMRSLRSSAALLRATFGFDGIRTMRNSAAAAIELADDPASPWHALALTGDGFSLYLSGEPGPADALRLPDGAAAQRARLDRLREHLGTTAAAGTGHGLTDREMTVLRMLRGTMTTAEIAQELAVSRNTVKTHIRSVYRKLGVAARPAAVTRARESGLLLFFSKRKPPTLTRALLYCGRSTRQLLVAVAYTLPASSVIRASASAVRLPKCTTLPVAVIGPVATVTGRRNFTDRSRLV